MGKGAVNMTDGHIGTGNGLLGDLKSFLQRTDRFFVVMKLSKTHTNRAESGLLKTPEKKTNEKVKEAALKKKSDSQERATKKDPCLFHHNKTNKPASKRARTYSHMKKKERKQTTSGWTPAWLAKI